MHDAADLATPRAAEADAIVLAGGRGTRMGGVDKAQIRLEGQSLLDRVLTGLLEAPTVVRAVVVGEAQIPPEAHTVVRQTVEDPPGSGPVAAVGAGMSELARAGRAPSRWTLVLAVDQPGAGAAVGALLRAVATRPAKVALIDALVPRDVNGRWQWLMAAYRTDALRAVLDELPELRDVSMRRVFGALRVGDVDIEPSLLGDIDTPADLTRWSPGAQA